MRKAIRQDVEIDICHIK